MEQLESNVAILTNVVNKLEIKCNDNEQYSRRMSLRIDIPSTGPNENGHKCVDLALQVIYSIPNVEVTKFDIQRAHRIGLHRIGKKNSTRPRQMIVKFKSWHARTLVYKGRKSLDTNKIFLDLTKRRFGLKMLAIEKVQGNQLVDFVFADVNCSLCFKKGERGIQAI